MNTEGDPPWWQHRRLLRLRRRHAALAIGDYRPIAAQGDLLLYERALGPQRFLVALNLGDQPVEVDFAAAALGGVIVLSTHGDREAEPIDGALALRDNEGLVLALSG